MYHTNWLFCIKNINFSDFEGKGVSYCAICDGFLYKNKKIDVIGGGDYAFKEASVLLNFTNDITILENRFFEQIVSVIGGILSLLILGSSFLLLNYKIGVPIILFGLLTMIIPFIFNKKINEKQLAYSDSISELTQKIKEYTNA